eukprot:12718114-Heterocapsa_arctica.AAC.1
MLKRKQMNSSPVFISRKAATVRWTVSGTPTDEVSCRRASEGGLRGPKRGLRGGLRAPRTA